LDFEGGRAMALNNADWLLELKYIDFLREIGRHFSVNRMLAAEAYRIRLEAGLSFIEFNYQVLQAYDFLVLHQRHNCKLQMGGDDQWGNIVAGIDLIRRVEGAEAFGLTFPLVTTATGEKMGKTAAGAVWLDARKTSPYEFYQYWINVDDRDVERFLAYFTLLPMAEVRRLGSLKDAEIRKAKEVLAFEVTRLTHGQSEAERAQAASRAAFGGEGHDLQAVPSTRIERQRLQKGIWVVELFAEVGLVSSRAEARRLIQQGGAYVGQQRVSSIEERIGLQHASDGEILLRAGKKRYHRVIVK